MAINRCKGGGNAQVQGLGRAGHGNRSRFPGRPGVLTPLERIGIINARIAIYLDPVADRIPTGVIPAAGTIIETTTGKRYRPHRRIDRRIPPQPAAVNLTVFQDDVLIVRSKDFGNSHRRDRLLDPHYR